MGTIWSDGARRTFTITFTVTVEDEYLYKAIRKARYRAADPGTVPSEVTVQHPNRAWDSQMDPEDVREAVN